MSNKFENEINIIIDSLTKYLDDLPSNANILDVKDKLIWIKDYFTINKDHEFLHNKALPDLKRGNVVLIKLGENLGMEFSGDHPGIILRNSKIGSDQVLILPLTTQKPKNFDPQNKNSIYLEIGIIPNLKGFQDINNPKNPDNGKHWANILNIKSISKQRIICPPDVSNINGKVLNKISATIVAQIALKNNNISQVKNNTKDA